MLVASSSHDLLRQVGTIVDLLDVRRRGSWRECKTFGCLEVPAVEVVECRVGVRGATLHAHRGLHALTLNWHLSLTHLESPRLLVYSLAQLDKLEEQFGVVGNFNGGEGLAVEEDVEVAASIDATDAVLLQED